MRKSTPGGTLRYIHDGDNLFMELDGSGNPVREYTYYPGVDQPHSVRMGGQSYYYTRERPGHVSGLLNVQGQVVNRYTYDPWGSVGGTETVTQPLRYGAREHDAETGLYYLRARYYDPGFGRFISEDPIGLEGGINLYAYAANDPGNLLDPFGLSPSDCNSQVGDWVDPRQETQRQLCFSLGGVASGSIDWPFSTGSNSGFGLQLGSRGSFGGGTGFRGPSHRGGGRKRDYVLEMITDFGSDAAECAVDHYGLGVVVGAVGTGMVVAGLPIKPKCFRMANTSRATSYASDYFSGKFPSKFANKKSYWAPTYRKPFGVSNVQGRVMGRLVPVVGGVLLLGDVAAIG